VSMTSGAGIDSGMLGSSLMRADGLYQARRGAC
jgi:hypothetical protein